MSTAFISSEFRNLSCKVKILARESNFCLATFLRRVAVSGDEINRPQIGIATEPGDPSHHSQLQPKRADTTGNG